MLSRPTVVQLAALGSVICSLALSQTALAQTAGLYPDLQTVVPRHLGIQNAAQREYLRFSNGIANTGPGDLRVRPEPPFGTPTPFTSAVQEVLDADGNVVSEHQAGQFAYHEAHNHWHIGDVALFEVRKARDDGRGGRWKPPYVNDRGQAQSIKTSFCLIDWYKLEGNSNTKDRTYWDCVMSYQGISPGWVDQYHQSVEGQEVDVTGAPEGIYYLVSVSNPDAIFAETDTANNTAWRSFELRRDSNGNPKIDEIASSPCASPGLCGEETANR
jgi:Lysyl oxidase